MKLDESAITILFNEEGLRIELHDRKSSTTFARIELNQEQTCQAIARLGYTPCKIEVRGTEKLNKEMLHKKIEFCLPEKNSFRDKEIAIERGKEVCPKDWIPDLSFNSQDSFFTKDGKNFARMIIRRWE